MAWETRVGDGAVHATGVATSARANYSADRV